MQIGPSGCIKGHNREYSNDCVMHENHYSYIASRRLVRPDERSKIIYDDVKWLRVAVPAVDREGTESNTMARFAFLDNIRSFEL